MPVQIKNVLVCDAVDESCIELLKQNGINVIKHSKIFLEFLFFIHLLYRSGNASLI